MLVESNQQYCIILGCLSRILLPLDFSKNGKNKQDVLLKWIIDAWYDEKCIYRSMVKDSFKHCGLTNKLNGEENSLIRCYDIIKEEVLQD